ARDPREPHAPCGDAGGPPRGPAPSRPGRSGRPRRRHRGRDDARGAPVSTYQRMLRYLRPYVWPHGTLAVAFMLVFSSIESSVPFLIKFTFDQVFSKQKPEQLQLA